MSRLAWQTYPMMKRSVALLFALSFVACERAVAPGRPLTFPGGPRGGDFILPIGDIAIPDSITPNETVDIRFSVGDGVDPCSFSNVTTATEARVTYVFPWGVDHPGSSCREHVFTLRVPGPYVLEDSVRGDTVYYHPMDPVHHRVIVCRPDGSFERRDMFVRVPAPLRQGVGIDLSDKVRTEDEGTCSRFQRWVLSGR